VFKDISLYILANSGKEFSAGSIAEYYSQDAGKEISSRTIYNYLDKMKKAYLLHGVSRYNLVGKASLGNREKYYAAGRFPGGFLKRESKPSDYEVLIARLVDRPIRPLWPDDFHLEVFVQISLISAEKDIQPDALAGLAASAALAPPWPF